MLGALYYPRGTEKEPIKFESLYIPFIYKEIYLDGIYSDIFNQKKDMVVMDVGANIGIVTQFMRDFAKKVYSIEPSPEHYEALKKNKEFNKWDNVETFELALADEDGEMDFATNSYNRTMNTLIIGELNDAGRYEIKGETGFDMGTAVPYEKGLKVKTMRFDTFMEENGIDEVDFVKFDVEGAENMILMSEGFKNVAEKVKAIEVEFHFPNWKDLVEYMIGLGFKARRYECSAVVVLFTR